MKRIVSLIAVMAILVSRCALGVFADSDSIEIFFEGYCNTASGSPFVSVSESLDSEDSGDLGDLGDYLLCFTEYVFDAIPEDFDDSEGIFFTSKISDLVTGKYLLAYGGLHGEFQYYGPYDRSTPVSNQLRVEVHYYDAAHLNLRPSLEDFLAANDKPDTPSPSVPVSGSLVESVTPDLLNGVLDQIVGLLPIIIPVLVAYIGLRKGLEWVLSMLHNS